MSNQMNDFNTNPAYSHLCGNAHNNEYICHKNSLDSSSYDYDKYGKSSVRLKNPSRKDKIHDIVLAIVVVSFFIVIIAASH